MIANPLPLLGEKWLVDGPDEANRRRLAADIMPLLRSLVSNHRRVEGHYTDAPHVLEFVNSHELNRLAFKGMGDPDNFWRAEFRPLVLEAAIMHTAASGLKKYLEAQFVAYRRDYTAYFEHRKHTSHSVLRDPNPIVILWPGLGMFTFAEDPQTARVVAEQVDWHRVGRASALVR